MAFKYQNAYLQVSKSEFLDFFSIWLKQWSYFCKTKAEEVPVLFNQRFHFQQLTKEEFFWEVLTDFLERKQMTPHFL